MNTRLRSALQRWRLGPALSALVLALGLVACQPGAGDSATQNLVVDPALLAQLDKLEAEVRAHPRETDDALRELTARQPAGSAARLTVLLLRTASLARTEDPTRYKELQAELDQWPGRENPRVATTLRLMAALMDARRALMANHLGDYRKALAVFDQVDMTGQPPRLLLVFHDMRAGLFNSEGQFEKALQEGHRALQLADSAGVSVMRRTVARLQLAEIYNSSQQFEQAVKMLEEAEHLAGPDASALLRHYLLTTRGVIYGERDREIAEKAWTAALTAARETGQEDLIALSLANLADASLRKRQWATAIELTTEAIRLAQRRKDPSSESLARHNLGIALMHSGQVARGRQEVETGLRLARESGGEAGMDLTHEEYGRTLYEVGLIQESVQAYLKEREIRRKLYRDDLRKTLLEAQESLEADRRSREIELLNRDMSLKNEQLRASQLEFRLWLLMGGCVLAAGVLLLMAYRRVRRTNLALQSTNERLKVQSERDPLTGLANRRHFQAAIRHREEQDCLRGSIFLIDIDHFKRINDNYGHAAGDSVLVEVSRRLRQALREEDLVVRWGGEEFLIVIKSCDPVFAQHLGQRLLEAIGGLPVRHERLDIPVTASIGFASLPIEPHGVSLHWERAIDMVDTLMYMAKAHGRNKAYGLQWADAPDGDTLLQLSEQMEAAWHDGKVRLSTPAGPAQWTEPRA